MNAIGIICEYNPFHLGHARMLEGLRRQYDAPLVCAMSGNFVQRGDAAVAHKHARGEMAVRCGADLVLELPTPWAMASAERFADGGVALLASTGVVSHLAFGSECGDLTALQAAEAALSRPELMPRIRQLLAQARFCAGLQLLGQALGHKHCLVDVPGFPADIVRLCKNHDADAGTDNEKTYHYQHFH